MIELTKGVKQLLIINVVVFIFTYLKLGFLLVAGGLAINISYQYLPIMVINILIISSQLLSVLIGYFFFKERLSPKQWMGLALIIISFFIVATSA
jgi:drug/metabolite transporter (DMT)-like permease